MAPHCPALPSVRRAFLGHTNMTLRKPTGRRYEVYTDPDLYRSQTSRRLRASRLAFLLLCLAALVLLGRPLLHSMLAASR